MRVRERGRTKRRNKTSKCPKDESLSGFELIFFSIHIMLYAVNGEIDLTVKKTEKERDREKANTQNKQFINTCNECFDKWNLPL